MTKKWDSMTEEEREEYANQDVVKKSWRESLSCEIGQELFNCLAETSGMADFNFAGIEWDENMFSGSIDPVDLECLRLFYCENMPIAEISETVFYQYVSGDRVFCSKGMSIDAVKRRLKAGRDAMKEALTKKNKTFLFTRKGKLTT